MRTNWLFMPLQCMPRIFPSNLTDVPVNVILSSHSQLTFPEINSFRKNIVNRFLKLKKDVPQRLMKIPYTQFMIKYIKTHNLITIKRIHIASKYTYVMSGHCKFHIRGTIETDRNDMRKKKIAPSFQELLIKNELLVQENQFENAQVESSQW